jgi:2-iminobutanoate/2-iminopropanoate deaminase
MRAYRFAICVFLAAGSWFTTGCASSGPAKQAVGPPAGSPLFSPVVRSGNLLFLSGVIGRSQEGDVGAATRQALEGVRGRLESANGSMSDVVKCTVFLVDMDHYDAMNRVYVEFFPSEPPARTAIAVRGLPAAALVEVDCIAAVR